MRAILCTVFFYTLFPAAVWATDSPSDLVKKLSDRSFKIRSDAAASLAKMGAAAIPALTEGSKNQDPEVAEQCKKLLVQAQAIEQQEKLAALLRDPTAPPPKGLAGAEQFFKVTGDSRAARELFVDLMRQHHEAIMTLEKDPKLASEMLFRKGEAIQDRFRNAAKTVESKIEAMVVSREEIALFLVFAADPRVNRVPRHFVYQNMLVLSKDLKTSLIDGEHSRVFRKLFVNWLFKEPIELYQQTGFELSADLKIPEMLPEAVKAINAKETPAKLKALAMLSLRQIGSKEHVKLLTPHLTDKRRVYAANVGGAIDVELRDIALGISIQLAGEKLADYGLGDRRFGDGRGIPTQLYYYGFPGDESRAKSHAQWQEWLKKNTASTVEK